MKKILYFVLFALVTLSFQACEDDKEVFVDVYYNLSVTTTDNSNVAISDDGKEVTVTLKPKGSSAEFTVVADQSWKLVTDQKEDWCEVAVAEDKITVSAIEFASEFRRQTVFTINGNDGKVITVTVKQAGTHAATLELEFESWTFPEEGGRKDVNIKTNMDEWTVTGHEDIWWLDVEIGENLFTVIAEPNNVTEDLTEILYVRAGNEVNFIIEEFEVTMEEWIPAWITATDFVQLKSDGSPVTINIETNRENWTAVPADNWLTATTGNGTVTFRATETDATRSTTVTLTAIGEGDDRGTATIEVKQVSGKFVLRFEVAADTEILLPLRGEVSATVDWGDNSSVEEIEATISNYNSAPTHTYTSAGTYQVTISGVIPQISLENNAANHTTRDCLTGIMEWGDLGTTNMNNGFHSSAVNYIAPGAEEMLKSVTTAGSLFQNCVNLTQIPSDLLTGATQMTNLSSMFSGCTGITEIPANLFAETTSLQNAVSIFQNSGITAIPSGLFDNCPEITSFQYTFSGCKSLTDIPAGLIDKQDKLTSLYGIFSESSITSIPAGFAKGKELLNNLTAGFRDCTELTSIGEEAFADCPALSMASNAFNGCTSLEQIPATLFKGSPSLSIIQNMFENSGLTSIPAGLYDDIEATGVNIQYMFAGTKITSIPDRLFANLSTNTFIRYVFMDCKELETIGEGVFEGVTTPTNVTEIFKGCISLKSLPSDLFRDCTAINVFTDAFAGCTSLTGESPYSEVGGEKIHFYERTTANGFANVTAANAARCFEGATGLTDYGNIPDAWK